ncbi:hypothetical protein TSUD_200300 [Trifolium subterraneum]|nr:hypothetical protein TSUD_200300 [Trifolium subterraneum]
MEKHMLEEVLAAKYGMRDGQVDNGGNRASSWWKNINSIRFENDVRVENWFGDNVVKRRGWELGGNEWRWRRRLFAWKEQLWGDCCTIVANVVLQVDSSYVWESIPDHDTGYSVGGAYHLLTRGYPSVTSHQSDLVWNKLVPSKNDSLLCSVGCDAIADIHHLFLKCPVFGAIWSAIISWLGITCVLPDNALSLTSQFCRAHGFSKKIKTCLQTIWSGGGLRQGKKVSASI